MKKYLLLLFTLLSGIVYSQGYNDNCTMCAESGGYYCGDDESNWTQYAPDGCVQAGWINDGWEDCVDAGDENDAVPTSIEDCTISPPPCDTVYVNVVEYINLLDTIEVPFFIYETEFIFDTIIETEYITQIVIDTLEIETLVPEYIYITDTVTVYEDVLDTLVLEIPIIEYVDTIIYDTLIETAYVEIFVIDTVVEYIEVINTEYLDCTTGLPCNSSIAQIIKESKGSTIMYNIYGQHIRKPQGFYIQNGEVKWLK